MGACHLVVATGDAVVAVDATALPTDPAGYDTLAADLCTVYEVDDLDAFFEGEGELAIEEGLERGCRWAVDGLPRSHFVSLAIQPATDPDIFETREAEVAGTTVLINSARTDSRGWILAPDGSGDLLTVTVHGEYGAPDGPVPDGYLEPAVLALVENLVERL